ncbi:unnamed protein product, partial [Cyprideis torosa]
GYYRVNEKRVRLLQTFTEKNTTTGEVSGHTFLMAVPKEGIEKIEAMEKTNSQKEIRVYCGAGEQLWLHPRGEMATPLEEWAVKEKRTRSRPGEEEAMEEDEDLVALGSESSSEDEEEDKEGTSVLRG